MKKTIYENKFYTLGIQQKTKHVKICMFLHIEEVNTRKFPKTLSLLNAILPSVLVSTCFNEANLPFATEVQKTEIGHLFEHILLEYLCFAKVSTGSDNATYSGVTTWDWKKDAWGTFHITVDSSYQDAQAFYKALQKTITLTSLILEKSFPAAPQPVTANFLAEPL